MHLNITPDTTIQQVQEYFHSYYKYLKLEFFNRTHDAFHGSHMSDRISDMGARLSDLGGVNTSVHIPIDPAVIVKDLEAAFEKLGVHVQVFRKSGIRWIETIRTDDFTLQEQNEMGERSDQSIDDDPIDYREQE